MDDFVADIALSGGDAQAAAVLWESLLDSRVVENFMPCPDDKLSEVLGIAEEELEEDLIMRLFEDLVLELPDQQVFLEYGAIDSARRVAQLVSRCRVKKGIKAP